MTEDEVREVVDGMTTDPDPEREYELRHANCVIDIPQSGERFDRDGGGVFNVCVILEFKDGKIARETRYYAEPFEAPGGRSQWRLPTEE